MNIAIIGSGGDGAGMNECLFNLCNLFKKHKIILFYHGLQGIIDNEIANIDLKTIKSERKKGGIIIKSSRSSEFLTENGFNKCIKNLNKNKIDLLIIMGGNGSLKACLKLNNANVKCIFIPTTIDNDIKFSNYSIGHSTAIENAVDFIEKVNTSMIAFDRTCIYEVMGRHCPDIALKVSKKVNACYCYTSSSTKQDLLKAVKKELKNNNAPIIILQENTTDINELKSFLSLKLKTVDVKSAVVGYVQRGGFATKEDLQMARGFAKKTAYCVKKGLSNVLISYDEKLKNFKCVSLEEIKGLC